MMTKAKTNAEEHRRREKACTACGTKEMDEYRASLIAAVMANTAAVPEAESDGGTFRIQDLIENAPNHAAAPEIINSIEKERIQQTYWLNEDEVSEKSV